MQNKMIFLLKNPSNFRGVFYFILSIILLTLNSQAQLKFKDTKKNFGFVKKGEVVKIIFEYKNIGNKPIIINDAKAECSCTTIEYTKQPISPNQTGIVTVLFDTKSVYDRQERAIELFSNSINSTQKLKFKGVVLNK